MLDSESQKSQESQYSISQQAKSFLQLPELQTDSRNGKARRQITPGKYAAKIYQSADISRSNDCSGPKCMFNLDHQE